MKEEKDKDALLWNFARVDYLLKLAEMNLTEVTEIEYRKEALVPCIKPKKLTDELKEEQIVRLEDQKEFLKKELDIPIIKS